jgi:hypothetical protein
VGKRTAILKLLSGEDQTLLVGRDSLLVLDFAGMVNVLNSRTIAYLITYTSTL